MENENVVITEQDNTEINQEPKEKTFTQQEVDNIIKKRLERERERYNAMINGEDPSVVDIKAREKAVTERELRLDAKEKLLDKKLPLELLDTLNYTNKEACDKSIEKIEKIFNQVIEKAIFDKIKGGPPMKKAPNELSYENEKDDLSKAFGL